MAVDKADGDIVSFEQACEGFASELAVLVDVEYLRHALVSRGLRDRSSAGELHR